MVLASYLCGGVIRWVGVISCAGENAVVSTKNSSNRRLRCCLVAGRSHETEEQSLRRKQGVKKEESNQRETQRSS